MSNCSSCEAKDVSVVFCDNCYDDQEKESDALSLKYTKAVEALRAVDNKKPGCYGLVYKTLKDLGET